MNSESILLLLGGLGLFLFGMKLMSEGIEKTAGAKLRSILEFFTQNKFSGMLVGIVFTAIVQSSSACTVMVVSFVNSGLMSLYQAAGVILGANIGTTVTAKLVAMNIAEYAPLFLFVGVIAVMFFKKWEMVTKVGEVVLGFGVLFMGLQLMSSSMASFRESEQVLEILSSMTEEKWWLAILVGALITAVIQSSSVTVSILVLMAIQGMILPQVCLYLILGCNIGSCASALLASLAGKKDAKRAAMIHFLFNVVGSAIISLGFIFFMDPVVLFLERISGFAANGQVFEGEVAGSYVANAHVLIKVTQVILLFPFTKWLVKASMVLVPGKDKKIDYRDRYQLQFIGEKVVFNPATAVVEVINEMERMAALASENLDRAMNALITLDQEDIDEVYEVEKNINYLNHAITDYLVKINQSTLPMEDRKSIGALFHVVNDIERIGDHAENVADSAIIRKERGITFSPQAQNELGEILEMVDLNLRYAIEMFVERKLEHMEDVMRLEDAIDEKERELQISHVKRLTLQQCSPEAGMLYSDLISGLERVSDHATNIAFSIVEETRLETDH